MRKNPLCRRPWGLWIPLALAAALLAVVVLAGQLAPYDPNAQIFPVLSAPSPAHPAGTDQLGRDLLSRILVGLRTSLISTLVLVAAISLTGAAVGVCPWRHKATPHNPHSERKGSFPWNSTLLIQSKSGWLLRIISVSGAMAK